MVLSVDDLVCLSRADMEIKKIDYANRMISIDPESIIRLEQAGLCDKKGNLTEGGIKKAEALKSRIADLRRGLPFERRKKSDHLKVRDTDGQWLTGTYKKKTFISDGYFLIFAKPYASMKPKKGSAEFQKAVPATLGSVNKMKNLVELTPRIWQMSDLGGIELIWLCDKTGETMVPVQGMYFDFAVKKFPSASFFGTKESNITPVQIRVKNQGFVNDVVGAFMPMDLNETIGKPNFDEITGPKN